MKRTSPAFAGLVLAFLACARAPSMSGGMADPERVADAVSIPEPAAFTDEMVREGQLVFSGAGICAVCHGPGGGGGIGPDLTDAEWLLGDGEYEEIVDRIMQGVSASEATFRRGATMPPKGGAAITDAQVEAVAAYVYTLSH